MADHTPQHGRRPHFHRGGRRGPDRRGTERRTTPREHAPEPGVRDTGRDSGVDVEQIMRDIRARIAQRHGIELSTQQIQELAARRLEAILEPRNVSPQLLEQLRKSAGAAPDVPSSPRIDTYRFEDTTLYETHRGVLRFFRKLLNPILKLFFNPTPLINALHTQARINAELANREIERERRQSEWNALQYELVRRVVLEVSRMSIDLQALANRVESLNAKVDFNDRRVRSLEPAPGAITPRPQPRQPEMASSPAVAGEGSSAEGTTGETAEGSRRRRRRRRGRRGGAAGAEGAAAAGGSGVGEEELEGAETVETDEDEAAEAATTDSPTAQDTIPEPALPALSSQDTPAAAPRVNPLPAEEPVVPSPPRDEPEPVHPVDHADAGPEDR